MTVRELSMLGQYRPGVVVEVRSDSKLFYKHAGMSGVILEIKTYDASKFKYWYAIVDLGIEGPIGIWLRDLQIISCKPIYDTESIL